MGVKYEPLIPINMTNIFNNETQIYCRLIFRAGQDHRDFLDKVCSGASEVVRKSIFVSPTCVCVRCFAVELLTPSLLILCASHPLSRSVPL